MYIVLNNFVKCFNVYKNLQIIFVYIFVKKIINLRFYIFRKLNSDYQMLVIIRKGIVGFSECRIQYNFKSFFNSVYVVNSFLLFLEILVESLYCMVVQ